jgi:hypothetical protein
MFAVPSNCEQLSRLREALLKVASLKLLPNPTPLRYQGLHSPGPGKQVS